MRLKVRAYGHCFLAILVAIVSYLTINASESLSLTQMKKYIEESNVFAFSVQLPEQFDENFKKEIITKIDEELKFCALTKDKIVVSLGIEGSWVVLGFHTSYFCVLGDLKTEGTLKASYIPLLSTIYFTGRLGFLAARFMSTNKKIKRLNIMKDIIVNNRKN